MKKLTKKKAISHLRIHGPHARGLRKLKLGQKVTLIAKLKGRVTHKGIERHSAPQPSVGMEVSQASIGTGGRLRSTGGGGGGGGGEGLNTARESSRE